MRASTLRSYKIGDPALCDLFRELARTLSTNGVDEISGINLYFTPWASGSKLTLYTPAGEKIDHLKIEPEHCRIFQPVESVRPSAGINIRVPDESTTSGPRWALADVGYLREKWRLSTSELVTLLGVSRDRLVSLLETPEAQLTDAEHSRISVLHEINGYLQDALIGLSVADWLRSNCTMLKFQAESPLAQLLTFGEPAISLMREALNHYFLLVSYGQNPGDLCPGFDSLLNMPVIWPMEWNAWEDDDD